ncbi:MAG: hypothetical protein U0271_21635 [Polyangiaceae bacterium]
MTPLTRAARLETLPVVFVTRSNLYLGLTGETGLEDLTTPESRAALEDGLVLTAPGWIVVPSGSLKLTRLYTALKLLEKARASVMLAVPVAKDAPRARGGGTPSDDTACDDTGVEVERPSSDNTTLRKLVTQAADQCGSPGPAAGGRSLTLHAKRGSSATSADVCVTTDEAGSPEFRSCAVAALRRSLATPLKNQKNPLELELVLEGPRVTAICPATP